MKACPFCGSRARVQSYKKCWAQAWARVMCTEKACAARGPTVRAHIKNEGDAYDALRAEAVRAWEARQVESRPYVQPSCGCGQCFCGGCP